MATRFESGISLGTTPFGVIVRTLKGDKLIPNGLNARVPRGFEVLIATNEDGPRVMARRQRR